MNRVFTTLVLCASFVGISVAHASNRDDQDEIFSGDMKNGAGQVIVGLGEGVLVGAIQLVVNAAEYDHNAVAGMKRSELKLWETLEGLERTSPERARKMVESREKLREASARLRAAMAQTSGGMETGRLTPERLQELAGEVAEGRKAVLSDVKEAVTSKASELPASKASAVRNEISKLERSLRRFKTLAVVGQALLIVDIAGRVYVWNALDRNPTYSPIATYVLKQSGKLLADESTAQ